MFLKTQLICIYQLSKDRTFLPEADLHRNVSGFMPYQSMRNEFWVGKILATSTGEIMHLLSFIKAVNFLNENSPAC
jgi:hypothetical protein